MVSRSSRAGQSLRGRSINKAKRSPESSVAGKSGSEGERSLSKADAAAGRWDLKTAAGTDRAPESQPAAVPFRASNEDQLLLIAMDSGIDLKIGSRAEVVAKALGSRAKLASILKVSTSQPTRWIKGQEAPNSENMRAIVDLEHVVLRARLLWGDDTVVNAWLTGRNGFLDGARPIDVIATQGSGPAIEALDQATAGAFA